MKGDMRGGRVALVSDRLLNPAPGAPDAASVLLDGDWGVVGLPPERLGEAGIAAWIAGVADQAAEFRRHGMAVVALLDPEEATVNRALKATLGALPGSEVPILEPAGDAAALAGFLDRHAGHWPGAARVRPAR